MGSLRSYGASEEEVGGKEKFGSFVSTAENLSCENRDMMLSYRGYRREECMVLCAQYPSLSSVVIMIYGFGYANKMKILDLNFE